MKTKNKLKLRNLQIGKWQILALALLLVSVVLGGMYISPKSPWESGSYINLFGLIRISIPWTQLVVFEFEQMSQGFSLLATASIFIGLRSRLGSAIKFGVDALAGISLVTGIAYIVLGFSRGFLDAPMNFLLWFTNLQDVLYFLMIPLSYLGIALWAKRPQGYSRELFGRFGIYSILMVSGYVMMQFLYPFFEWWKTLGMIAAASVLYLLSIGSVLLEIAGLWRRMMRNALRGLAVVTILISLWILADMGRIEDFYLAESLLKWLRLQSALPLIIMPMALLIAGQSLDDFDEDESENTDRSYEQVSERLVEHVEADEYQVGAIPGQQRSTS